MSIIDIIILVVFIGAAVYGWWRGMIVQIGSLAGVLLGILLCRLFGDGFSGFLIDTFGGKDPVSADTRYVTGVIARSEPGVRSFFFRMRSNRDFIFAISDF